MEDSVPNELTALEEGVVKSQNMDFDCLTSQRGIYQDAIEAEGPLTGGTPSMDLEATHSQGHRHSTCACSVTYDSVTPQTVAHQAPLSIGFPRREYWSELPCPPPGDLPIPEVKPGSSASPAFGRQSLYQWVTWEAPFHKGICFGNFSKLRFFNYNQVRILFLLQLPLCHMFPHSRWWSNGHILVDDTLIWGKVKHNHMIRCYFHIWAGYC